MTDFHRLQLLVLDVDGILTDGRLYVGADGQDWKAFSILDGAGIKLWMQAGFRVAVISGHASEAVKRRFERLGVTEVHVGVAEKRPVLDQILAKAGLSPASIAVMGDDLVDLPLFRGAGFTATVPGAHLEVRARAQFVTERPGGSGAVREVIDLVLKEKGLYAALVQSYLR